MSKLGQDAPPQMVTRSTPLGRFTILSLACGHQRALGGSPTKRVGDLYPCLTCQPIEREMGHNR